MLIVALRRKRAYAETVLEEKMPEAADVDAGLFVEMHAAALVYVGHDGRRQVDDRVPRLPAAVAEVHVLDIEEKSFVEARELLVERARNEEGGSHAPVDGCRSVVGEVFQEVGLYLTVFGAIVAAREYAAEENPEGRESSDGELQRSVGVFEARGDDAGRRVGLEVLMEAVDGAGREDDVGVEDEDVFSGGLRGADVVVAGEAEGMLVADESDLGIMVADELVAAVCRAIIDDNRLESGRRLSFLIERAEHFADKRQMVHDHGDDRYFNHGKSEFAMLLIQIFVRFLVVERHPAGGVIVAEGLTDSIRGTSVVEGKELFGAAVEAGPVSIVIDESDRLRDTAEDFAVRGDV